MRSMLHLALWGAVFLGACSSGGPGNVTNLSFTYEMPGDQHEAPGTVLSGESAGSQSGSGSSGTKVDSKNPTTTTGGSDGGTTIVIEAGTSAKDSGSSTPAASCTALDACCASLPSAQKTSCDSAVKANQESTCAAYLAAATDAGICG